MLGRIGKRVKRWYVGERIPQPDVMYVHERYRRHWTAQFVGGIYDYLRAHWQPLVLTLLTALIGLAVKAIFS